MEKIELENLELIKLDTIVSKVFEARRKCYETLKTASSTEDAKTMSAFLNNLRNMEYVLREINYSIQGFNESVNKNLVIVTDFLNKTSSEGENVNG